MKALTRVSGDLESLRHCEEGWSRSARMHHGRVPRWHASPTWPLLLRLPQPAVLLTQPSALDWVGLRSAAGEIQVESHFSGVI